MANDQPANNKAKARVLIVDDEPALLDIYSTKLRTDGFDVSTAVDGVEGTEAIVNNPPDIVLLDVIMPGKDGFEVLKDIKANPKTKGIPVIVLSNLGQEYEVKRGIALGANLFLTKADLTPAKIEEAVVKVLQKYGIMK